MPSSERVPPKASALGAQKKRLASKPPATPRTESQSGVSTSSGSPENAS
jgi:hypothetical protein